MTQKVFTQKPFVFGSTMTDLTQGPRPVYIKDVGVGCIHDENNITPQQVGCSIHSGYVGLAAQPETFGFFVNTLGAKQTTGLLAASFTTSMPEFLVLASDTARPHLNGGMYLHKLYKLPWILLLIGLVYKALTATRYHYEVTTPEGGAPLPLRVPLRVGGYPQPMVGVVGAPRAPTNPTIFAGTSKDVGGWPPYTPKGWCPGCANVNQPRRGRLTTWGVTRNQPNVGL